MVEEQYLPVWRYLRFLGCSESIADDLAQETFVVVLNRPPVLSDPGALPAYLRSVAKNLYLKSLRRAKSAPALQDLERADAVWERCGRPGDWDAYLEAVRGCLDGLDAGDRELLEKYYRRKITRAGAAAELGFTEEGLKTHLRRLKDRLKRCVKGKLSHE
jgi:RNA polymerase sigma-70 factor (ECF subfamily)